MDMDAAAPGGDRDDKIRELAYLIWIEEGRPDGRDVDHWLKACDRLARVETAPVAAIPADPPVKPAKAAKPKAAAAAKPKKAPAKR